MDRTYEVKRRKNGPSHTIERWPKGETQDEFVKRAQKTYSERELEYPGHFSDKASKDRTNPAFDGIPLAFPLSVTQRITGISKFRPWPQFLLAIQQPRGGYISPKSMSEAIITKDHDLEDQSKESVVPALMGCAVDLGTRILLTGSIDIVAEPLKEWAKDQDKSWQTMVQNELHRFMNPAIGFEQREKFDAILGLASIEIYRRSFQVLNLRSTNKADFDNFYKMIASAKELEKRIGRITQTGVTFEGGYTHTVSLGEADMLTQDALIDIKTSKYPPTAKHTLQLLLYWRLGIHSENPDAYQDLTSLGIWNPRLGIYYSYPIEDIENSTIQKLDSEILAYER